MIGSITCYMVWAYTCLCVALGPVKAAFGFTNRYVTTDPIDLSGQRERLQMKVM